MRSLRIALIVTGSVWLSPALGDPIPGVPGGEISIRVESLRNGKGQAGCLLYAGERGFPGDSKQAIQQHWCPINNQVAVCHFPHVPAGTYAALCFHDENNNSDCDTNFLGIPKEGTGASNDAHSSFGPPKYKKAKFEFDGTALEIPVKIHY